MSRWPRVQIRKLAKLGTGHTPSRSVEEQWVDCSIPWLTLADVGPLRSGTALVVAETKETISPLGLANSAAVLHPAGTVAMSRTASVGYSCILGVDMATSQDYVTWTCGPKLHNRFLLWALRGERESIIGRMIGSTHKTIYMPDIEQLDVPVPPLADQRAIADYLGAETARIDALIAKKQQLIHLLEERRSRLALAGIIGELTHDGPVRDSRLEWVDTIPAHWDVALLRLVARQGTGHTPSRGQPEWWNPDECVVPWVTTGEVRQVRSDRVRTISETREQVSHIGIANSSAEIHPKNTVFLCRTASAGYSGIMGVDMATSQDFATWTCGERLDSEYLLFCLRAMRADLLGRLATGSTHKTIYMPDIQALKIPVPPIQEQQQIASLVKRETDRSFAVADALTRQLELLAEHRQALITAAVTGEFTVPGAV